MHTTGHQIITRTFGRALGQHRGFNVDEAVLVQKLAHFHGDFVAQHQIVLHVRPAQIEHAVGQASGLGQVFIVEQKGRRDRGVEHDQLMAEHFNFAAL